MIEMIKEKYREYLYLEIIPKERKNAAFYEKFGFKIITDGVAIQLCNFNNKSSLKSLSLVNSLSQSISLAKAIAFNISSLSIDDFYYSYKLPFVKLFYSIS